MSCSGHWGGFLSFKFWGGFFFGYGCVSQKLMHPRPPDVKGFTTSIGIGCRLRRHRLVSPPKFQNQAVR